ncbi:hypothetical protein BCR35DRAFT_353898 [Leucosporidium creatinivorum]|uniref:Uncharacterized protein n=1 Tax=Leucosporidium creatinivorum TaxID=106004 RepID=A0A1Y2ERY1_9BASI|nr:hypothetical protein BCR35DRAFT_353898 [Leucosporidium creatinivorum]
MMASPHHPPPLVASGSTYSPLTSPYSTFSSPRFEHPSSTAGSSSWGSANLARHDRPCFQSNGSVYSDISSNEDFDFSDPAPLSSVPSPALAPSSSAPKPKSKPKAQPPNTSRPILPTGDSVLSDLSPTEDLDFSDPIADAAAASRAQAQPSPAPPAAPPTRRPIQRFSPDGYPFPWVLSRPATPPTLPSLEPPSAFSTPSTSGQNTPSHSPFINDVEAQTTTITSREIDTHGSRPLPDTPAAEIPTTPVEHVQSRGLHAGSTPGCAGPLPLVSGEEEQEDEEEQVDATPKQRLRKRKSANALLAARMMGGLSSSSAMAAANQPAVASPLREVVE